MLSVDIGQNNVCLSKSWQNVLFVCFDEWLLQINNSKLLITSSCYTGVLRVSWRGFRLQINGLILVYLSHSILPRFAPHSQLCLWIFGFVTGNSHIFLIDTTIYHSLSYSGRRYRLFNEISDVDDPGNSSFVHINWQITSVRVTPSLTRHASVVRRRRDRESSAIVCSSKLLIQHCHWPYTQIYWADLCVVAGWVIRIASERNATKPLDVTQVKGRCVAQNGEVWWVIADSACNSTSTSTSYM